MATDDELRERLEAARGRSVSDDEFTTFAEIIRDPDAYQVHRPGAVVQLLAKRTSNFAYGLCVARTWQIHRYDQPMLFTGDVPVQLWRDDDPPGIATADEVTIALDAHHLLVMSQRDDLDDDSNLALPTVAGNADRISRHLQLITMTAHRAVFVPPAHPLASKLPVPPPAAPHDFHEDLIELARKVGSLRQTPPAAET